MLANLDVGKLLVLLAVGLVVLGPERLPQVAADAGRLIRALRRLAHETTGELRAELAPHLGELGEVQIAELHPGRLLERYLQAQDPTLPGEASGSTPGPSTASPPPGQPVPYDREAT